MHKLKGKIAVVTGGNSGIGFATAQEFIAQGAEVVITGRNQAAIDAAVAKLGSHATGILSEASNLQHTDALVEKVKAKFGKVDVLFINAGVFSATPLGQTNEEMFDTLMDINFKGAFFTLEKFLPLLADGASVIHLSSVSAQSGMPGSAIYAASKAAMNAINRTAAIELAPRKIRVNSINPGPVATEIFGKSGLPEADIQNFAAALQGRLPMKRFGTPEDVARLVTFLASDDAAFITGSEYAIDGGIGINAILS